MGLWRKHAVPNCVDREPGRGSRARWPASRHAGQGHGNRPASRHLDHRRLRAKHPHLDDGPNGDRKNRDLYVQVTVGDASASPPRFCGGTTARRGKRHHRGKAPDARGMPRDPYVRRGAWRGTSAVCGLSASNRTSEDNR